MSSGPRFASVAGSPYTKVLPVTTACFLVNACMGMGFLSLPYWFVQAGVVAGSAIVITCGTVATMSSLWIVASMANYEALKKSMDRRSPDFTFSSPEIHLSGMVSLGCGTWGNRAFIVALHLFVSGALWSYGTTVASSMANIVPLPTPFGGFLTCDIYLDHSAACRALYSEWLVLFGAVVVPLACKDLKDQAKFQMAMTAARFLLVAMILGDCSRVATVDRFHEVPAARSAGYAGCCGAAVFSFALQYSIPEAVQDMADKHKYMKNVVTSAVSMCAVVFVMVGISVPLAFGSAVEPLATLNWATMGEPEPAAWQVVFRTVLMIAPVLDLAAAFPIQAICLGDNLRSSIAGEDNQNRAGFRLAASLPPLVGALVIYDVSGIVAVTGLCGLGVCLVLPAMLLLGTTRKLNDQFGARSCEANPAWGWFCRTEAVVATQAVVGVLVVGTVVATAKGSS
mmetsp:Transcript_4535/g.10645  ORF Transcript_4535/g.10645 Transcript_4535/m.10645 type:complete len:454 (-) Transcript_4535:9-1370(-)